LTQFFLTFGILGGVGTSLLFTPSIAVVGHWFPLRRGLATGIVTTGGSVGGIAWSRTICLVLCGFSNVLIRSRLPAASNVKPRPYIRIFREPAFALTTLDIFLLGLSMFIPLADRFGPFNANILAVLLSVVACLGVWLPFGSTPQGIVVFAVIFGFASGSNISVGPVAIRRLCRTEEYGSTMRRLIHQCRLPV
jgi:MFS family permease